MHAIMLEVGTRKSLVDTYCNQVVACLSDQGSRNCLAAWVVLSGTELLLSEMPRMQLAAMREDDALALQGGEILRLTAAWFELVAGWGVGRQ